MTIKELQMRGDPTGLIVVVVAIAGAALLGLIIALRTTRNEVSRLAQENTKLSGKAMVFEGLLAASNKQLEQTRQNLMGLTKIIEETGTFYPSLAEAIADYHFLQGENSATYLATKKHPARSASESVSESGRARRLAERELRQLKYQLLSYESMFPWLLEVSGRSTKDVLAEWKRRASGDSEVESDPSIEPERRWLTPEEYARLSSAERADLALERWWQSRRENAWEAGRDYERFVGYNLEQEGHGVAYWGAIEGLADMGRDLIAVKDGATKIVQCKRWATEKVIHEKHIFQLIGTALEYACSHNNAPIQGTDLRRLGIIPMLVTTTRCSDKARTVASILGVTLLEEYSLKPYPVVKCNVSTRSMEKIYHLPFDQQYDRIRIEQDKGECYVETAIQAERLGFRRAWRHIATN